MSGERILQGLREAVEYAESAPSDTEVEAMAERLWMAWQSVEAPSIPLRWVSLVEFANSSANFQRNVEAFRAMARVALERP